VALVLLFALERYLPRLPGVLIVRPDAPLFYAHAELVRDAIEQSAGSARAVVLVLDGNDNLDITSAEQLGKLAGGLAARNVPIGLAHVHGPALEMAERSGLLATVGADHVFPTTPAAVAWAQSVADAPGLCCLRGDDPPRPADKR
jgi:MFS superfamily sulfate permease-like transporter